MPWTITKQKIVALSSTEAEYIALSTTVQDAIWINQLSSELGMTQGTPMKIFCDNQSTIKLAENSGYKPRTKHIDVRHHFIRDCVKDGKIMVEYIGTERNVADALTKSVTQEKLNYYNIEMGLKA